MKPVKKIKEAVQKANYKAGAVKNKMEAKVVGAAKKVAGAVKKANYKAGAAKNKMEAKVLDRVKKQTAGKGGKYLSGGKLEKDDKRSKRSGTIVNKARLKAAKKNLARKTAKYGSVSEAAEKGSKAVRKVTRAEDRVKRVAALAGRDSSSGSAKKVKAKAPKPPKAVKSKPSKAPKVRFAGGSSGSKQGGVQFNEAREKGRLRSSKKAGCYGNNCK